MELLATNPKSKIQNPKSTTVPEFSLKHARTLVSDLFVPKPWIYWTDFLVSLTIGYSAALVFLRAEVPLSFKLLAYAITVVALYRVSLFMHEISHMRRGEMRGFKVTWNGLAGVPMMIPSFFYETHLDHHNTKHYGTDRDGEYLPLASGSIWGVVAFIAQVFYLPVLTFIRFLVITPISLFVPSVRRWALEHWSSFVINLRFRREVRERDPLGLWLLVEVACHFRVLAILVLIAIGFDPWYTILMLYAIAVGILTLNHIRTLAAHRYRSDGHTMSHHDQLLDSTDIVGGGWANEALLPVGLRFHALHHMFPGLPYHNLRKAHHRLVEHLPADSPYHQCVYPSMTAVFKELWQEIKSRSAQTEPAAPAPAASSASVAVAADE